MEPTWSNLGPKSTKFDPKSTPGGSLEGPWAPFGGPRAHFGEQLGPRSEPDRPPDGVRMGPGGPGALPEGAGRSFGGSKSTSD